MKILDRYNDFYNLEMSALPHGQALSMEHLQAITLECAVKAFARKYNSRKISQLKTFCISQRNL